MSVKDAFAVLGVGENVNLKEVRRAYRGLAKLWHPDKNPSTEAEERFKSIKNAYETIEKLKKTKPIKRTNNSCENIPNISDTFDKSTGGCRVKCLKKTRLPKIDVAKITNPEIHVKSESRPNKIIIKTRKNNDSPKARQFIQRSVDILKSDPEVLPSFGISSYDATTRFLSDWNKFTNRHATGLRTTPLNNDLCKNLHQLSKYKIAQWYSDAFCEFKTNFDRKFYIMQTNMDNFSEILSLDTLMSPNKSNSLTSIKHEVLDTFNRIKRVKSDSNLIIKENNNIKFSSDNNLSSNSEENVYNTCLSNIRPNAIEFDYNNEKNHFEFSTKSQFSKPSYESVMISLGTKYKHLRHNINNTKYPNKSKGQNLLCKLNYHKGTFYCKRCQNSFNSTLFMSHIYNCRKDSLIYPVLIESNETNTYKPSQIIRKESKINNLGFCHGRHFYPSDPKATIIQCLLLSNKPTHSNQQEHKDKNHDSKFNNTKLAHRKTNYITRCQYYYVIKNIYNTYKISDVNLVSNINKN